VPKKVDRARGMLFGSVADNYERYRLDYPADVVDAVLQYAGQQVASALEVGAGTGKATRVFGSRGIEVTALEPDAEMARVLERETSGLPVTTMVTTFERFRTDSRYDLVYAAAAWHWTNPATRWHQAAELLAPDGVLAIFGRPSELKDPDLFSKVDEIEKRLLPAEDPGDVHAWSVEEMTASDGFGDIEQCDLPSAIWTTREAFVGRLATVSAYLMLDPEMRAEALREVQRVVPDKFEIDTTVQLSLARRKSDAS
jgi:SAM-dependent methyltransferase